LSGFRSRVLDQIAWGRRGVGRDLKVSEVCDKIVGRKRPNPGIKEFPVRGNRQLWIDSRQQVPPLNSQKYKIQALIAEIDEVLSKPVPRLPWTGSMDTVHQRQLLERVRTYLVSPDSNLVADKEPSSSPTVRPEVVGVTEATAATNQQAVDQILLAVTGEISHLREDLIQPLHEDIQALRQEQEALVQEIQQLEAKRQQQQSLAQQQANQQQIIAEFLQALTISLQETLARGVFPIPGSVENQWFPGAQAIALDQASDKSRIEPNQQTNGEQGEMRAIEQIDSKLQLFQADVDRLMTGLDSRMSVVFETLEANLLSYQESLSQGIEKMHGLGQQSEVMFAALVNHLAAQLGREASSYVQQPLDTSTTLSDRLSTRESATSTAGDRTPASPLLPNPAESESTLRLRSVTAAEAPIPNAQVESENLPRSQFREQEKLPYAGTEMSPQFGQLRRDRDRAQLLISLPDLAEDLFGDESLGSGATTPSPGAESEVELAETGEDVEDLYASVFLFLSRGEEVAELELEDFPIENTENAADLELVESQTSPEYETSEPLIAADLELVESQTSPEYETSEPLIDPGDFFANLLDEDLSVEDVQGRENSDFVIANSVEEDLTLDTEDLFEPEVAGLPQVSAPLTSTSEPQLDLEERKNQEIAPNNPAGSDSAVTQQFRTLPPPPPPPPAFRTAPSTTSTRPDAPPGVPCAGEVQTGELGAVAQRLDDAYIQASPEEDLLPIARSEELLDRTLNLDNNTLQQLEADLYSMEGAENPIERRSPPSVPLNSQQLTDSPDGNPENPPFDRHNGQAAEEFATLDDLFAHVLEASSDEDETLSWEEELDAELFSSSEASSLSLDEILVSLTQTENPPMNSPNQESETAEETNAPQSNSGEIQKKNLISTETKAEVIQGKNELAIPPQPDADGVAAVLSIGKTLTNDSDRSPSLFSTAHPQELRRSNWYLGIDFGSTGLSAALLDRTTRQVYPIYWEARRDGGAPQDGDSEVCGVALSVVEVFDYARAYRGSTTLTNRGSTTLTNRCRIPSVAVLEDSANSSDSRQAATSAGQFLLQNFKLLLKVGIPDRSEADGMYEPVFQLSQDRAVSIAWPLQGLRALLATLAGSVKSSIQPPTDADSATTGHQEGLLVPNLICRACGFEDQSTLDAALEDLQGVILGTPANWSDAYRFNLREAVLGAGLVGDSSQIFVVEDAIATLLSAVTNLNLTPGRSGESIADDRVVRLRSPTSTVALDEQSLIGGTLILNAGAATVELALVDLPENMQDLTYADFTCQSFAYAGNAFDQDIICQLLAVFCQRMLSKSETFGMSIELPRPGHPDLPSRYQLQQRLQSSEYGLQLLEAARHLKVILQHQESFVLELGQQRLEVKRRDLEKLVLVPFVQQLNRELNALLSRVGMSPVGINQVICTGGMGSLPSLARWLRQKLPNAQIIKDPEMDAAGEVSLVQNAGLNSTDFNLVCSQYVVKEVSRVACGLASLPLYPQILDVSRQQYSDFFLLWELMQVLGEETLSFEEIVQLLERQGVNTRTCEARLLGILEGRRQDALLPTEEDLMLLTEESRQNPYWEAISAAPLFFSMFSKSVDRGFRLNVEHASIVREYLSKLASSSQQYTFSMLSKRLLEPLTIAWDVRSDI